MSDGTFSDYSDDVIAKLSPAERRDLIHRLERPLEELLPPRTLKRLRLIRMVVTFGAVAGLIPWIVYLGLSLPDRYVTYNWTATWVGFDTLLLGFMGATAVLGLLRRQLLVLTAFTTGVLLVCDAWFDVMTAAPFDRWLSVLTAVLAELPMAVLLITGSLRILRLTVSRLWLLDSHAPLWRVPLLP
jgi:hypothetical protein